MSWKGDPNAFHQVVDGEIAGLTEKASPVDADWALINDSADGNSVKKAQLGNLPGGGSGGAVALERTQNINADAFGDNVATVGTGSRSELKTQAVTVADGDLVLVSYGAIARRSATSSWAGFLVLERKTGTDLESIRYHSHGFGGPVDRHGVFIDQPGEGTHTYAVDFSNDAGSSGSVIISHVEFRIQVFTPRAFTNLGDGSELTISAGAITKTQGFHTVDTEADAATDDLETINGGTTGDLLVLKSAADGRDPTLKDGTGNLALAGDFTLSHTDDTITLIYDGTNWCEISRSDNG